MEPLLVGVTLFSLALAITMTAVAWKLLHHARQREAARTEALESLAFEAQPDDEVTAAPASGRVMRVPSERAAPAEEPRWDVTLHAPDVPLAPRITAAGPLADEAIRDRRAPSVTFESASDRQSVGRRWLILAAVALVMIATVATLSALRSPEIVAAVAASRAGSEASAAGTPLELLSLRNATEGGQFTVTGLVQNPQNGRALGRVVAVVYLFDNTGRYFATGQAALDAARLDPGSESPFVVTVPNATGVGHYRVGFRTDTGAVVMHVDRRGQFPDGTTGDALPGDEPATAHANAPAHADGDAQ